MTKNNNKGSAKKKLLPAVAMLTTSAVMLSTATYAWFTMNKEVEVTGLKMAATAGDSLEITLGGLGVATGGTKAGSTPTNTTFGSVEDLGWGRSEAIDSYYSTIAKIKPASSNTSLSLFKVNEDKVYAGGQAVESDAAVTLLAEDSASYIKLDAKYDTEELTNEKTEENKTAYKEGYFVDIPMWIRTSNSESRAVNAFVKITDPNDANGSDLINAVRVALIPVAGVTDLSAEASSTALTYTPTGTYTVGSIATNATIFGLTDSTYNSKVLAKAGTYNDTGVLDNSQSIVKAADNFTTDGNGFVAKNGENQLTGTSIFTMPQATKDKYAAVLVVARVWIEGESTYCNDATANQDWNIDFHFELADAASST